jgi:hypothetical protein
MKIRPVVAEFRVDGRTDRYVAFFSFASGCNKIVMCETVSRLYHPRINSSSSSSSSSNNNNNNNNNNNTLRNARVAQ